MLMSGKISGVFAAAENMYRQESTNVKDYAYRPKLSRVGKKVQMSKITITKISSFVLSIRATMAR